MQESNEFDGAFKKKEPNRVPRRRQVQQLEEEDDNGAPSPVAGSKKSGWGDEGDGGGVAAPVVPRRRRAADEEEKPDQEPLSRNKHLDDDDDDGIPMIRDLEDHEEDMARTVAAAPSLKSSRVPNIKELDALIEMSLPSASQVGADLTVLSSFLTPPAQVQDADTPWDVEQELAAIASEMAKERDEMESDTLKAPGYSAIANDL